MGEEVRAHLGEVLQSR